VLPKYFCISGTDLLFYSRSRNFRGVVDLVLSSKVAWRCILASFVDSQWSRRCFAVWRLAPQLLRRGLGGGSDWSRLEVHNRRGEAGGEGGGRGLEQERGQERGQEAVQEANPILELRYGRRETEIR
jgi:hypothetical protein